MAVETDLNHDIRDALRGMDPQRVENSVGPGTPDINYMNGWLESKMVWFPKRPDTVLRIPHYTREQRGWSVRRCNAGGLVHVVLRNKANTETLVFDAPDAAEALGVHWTVTDCRRFARLYLSVWDARKFRRFIVSACAARGALVF